MDDAAIDAFCETGPDSSFLKSIVTPAKEEYESDLLKFIKDSEIIPEGCIKISKKGISVYKTNGELESWAIASPATIEFTYKYKYIELRDKKTLESIKDNFSIVFDDAVKSVVNVHDGSSEEDDSDDAGGDGITYKSFMEKTYELEDPEDLVLPCSYILIHYNNPCWKESVTFHIPADDEMLGFKRLELMKKSMERFHLLYYLFINYNVEEGKINPDRSSYLFHPLISRDEYTDNGLRCLTYNKEKDYWIFKCIDEN